MQRVLGLGQAGGSCLSLLSAACSVQHRPCTQAWPDEHPQGSVELLCVAPPTLLRHVTALTSTKQGAPLSCTSDTGPLSGAGPARLNTSEVLVVGGFP